jgi:hypothetical protein
MQYDSGFSEADFNYFPQVKKVEYRKAMAWREAGDERRHVRAQFCKKQKDEGGSFGFPKSRRRCYLGPSWLVAFDRPCPPCYYYIIFLLPIPVPLLSPADPVLPVNYSNGTP